nr:hypothetical protein [Tanacetum cinerariifolium]
MASKHSSLEPALYEMTPTIISSGLVPNPSPSTPYVPPSRTDWDILFQPLFDELLNPSPSVDLPAPKFIAIIAEYKYALESLKKYGTESSDPMDTPMVEKSNLDKDTQVKAVDPTHYRRMVGTLMYLTASTPDLTFDDYSIALTAYADANHAGCQDARRSTPRSMQLLGDRLVSWSSKRQKSATISSTKAEYIALYGCYAQVLWMKSQLTDYGLGFNKILMYSDNKSAIAL